MNNHPPFTILTESWYRYDRLKRWLLRLWWKILWRKIYGPMSVYYSLVRWLEELKKEWNNIVYNVNPSQKDIHDIVVVLIGKDTLRYVLDLKQQWIIKKLLAWPAISVPIDNHDTFFDPNIDHILIPSNRVRDYFVSLWVNVERILLWPAGVADTGISKKLKNTILIYKKTCPDSLYQKVIDFLELHWYNYITLHYGKFQFSEYQQLLDESVAMIYLQESESQWIALQEAWIKDIPTLVWDRWYRIYKHIKRESKQISCPLMVDECGMLFTETDFRKQFTVFISKLSEYSPRRYCTDNLSDRISAKKLLSYISL